MDVIELIPGLHFLHFPVRHAYLCEHPDGLTLIDTSVPGSAPHIPRLSASSAMTRLT